MQNNELTREKDQIQKLAQRARALIARTLCLETSDAFSLMLGYNGFCLQIEIIELHPVLVINLSRQLSRFPASRTLRIVNVMNLKTPHGSHAVNMIEGSYSYRCAHWIDDGFTRELFLRILHSCANEASRAYARLDNARETIDEND